MAESGLDESAPEAHEGAWAKIKATFKKIKPGEWILIAVGVVGLVLYFVWYRNQQNASNSASTTNPNPAWGSAQAEPNGTFSGEIADLLTQLASQVPNTSPTNSGGATSGGSATAAGGLGGSAAGTGTAGEAAGGTVAAPASSGSGLTQQGNNSSPVTTLSQIVNGTGPTTPSPLPTNSLGLPENTGTVGIPINSIVTPPSTATASSPARAPANVSSGSVAATGATAAGSTVGAMAPRPPTTAPINVVTSLPSAPVTHAAAPSPAPAPATKVTTPTKAPPNVRPA